VSPANRLVPPIFEPPAAKAIYATIPGQSRGRYYPEPESSTRTCFSRDRDRIIHSTAFRRLKHKTQVFVQHEGDYYRTRLTHSLEVAQIARSIARVLALDEDLAEAVALAHDLGHTPFGHAGEEALSAATAAAGGFDHNAHALRLVTELEHRYAAFDGLNLTWESLEGLVKHNGPIGADGRALASPIARFDALWPLDLGDWPGLEAQAAALADDIAYVNHDIDDGLRAGLFTVDELGEAPLVGVYVSDVRKIGSRFELGRFIGELVHRLMNRLVGDVLTETDARLRAARPSSAGGARRHGRALVSFSSGTEAELMALKKFLYQRMYRHPRILEAMGKAKLVISDLCRGFADDPTLMPSDWTERCGTSGDLTTLSVVRDYIAGMTDRYALLEHARITHTEIAI
jgi:dGTPase